ncbi:MAG: type II secretion system protein N [Gammaproteobacteria bacterium]
MVKGIVFGLFVYALALVATAPATLALPYIPPHVRAYGVDGSLWHGNAENVQINAFELGRTDWTLDPLPLIGAKLGANVEVKRSGLQGTGRLTAGRTDVEINDADITADAVLINPYLRQFAGAIQGIFDVKLATLAFDQQKVNVADGNVMWREAQISAPFQIPLGEVSATLTQKGNNVEANISNNGGQLGVKGKIILQPGWRYQIDVQLQPLEGLPEAIRSGLGLIGKPDARGAVRLRQQGQLRV